MSARTLAFASILLIASSALAEETDRLEDQFAFGVYAGPAWSAVDRLTLGGRPQTLDQALALEPQVGLQLSFWPTDYFGFEFDGEGHRLSLKSAETGAKLGGSSLRLAAMAKLALPLRYLGLTVGAGPAFHMESLEVSGLGGPDLTGQPSPDFGWRFTGGANFYVSPQFRLSLEYQRSTFDFATELTPKGGGEAVPIASEGFTRHAVSLGAAYTPDEYRLSARKVMWIAWSTIGIAGLATALYAFQ